MSTDKLKLCKETGLCDRCRSSDSHGSVQLAIMYQGTCNGFSKGRKGLIAPFIFSYTTVYALTLCTQIAVLVTIFTQLLQQSTICTVYTHSIITVLSLPSPYVRLLFVNSLVHHTIPYPPSIRLPSVCFLCILQPLYVLFCAVHNLCI